MTRKIINIIKLFVRLIIYVLSLFFIISYIHFIRDETMNEMLFKFEELNGRLSIGLNKELKNNYDAYDDTLKLLNNKMDNFYNGLRIRNEIKNRARICYQCLRNYEIFPFNIFFTGSITLPNEKNKLETQNFKKLYMSQFQHKINQKDIKWSPSGDYMLALSKNSSSFAIYNYQNEKQFKIKNFLKKFDLLDWVNDTVIVACFNSRVLEFYDVENLIKIGNYTLNSHISVLKGQNDGKVWIGDIYGSIFLLNWQKQAFEFTQQLISYENSPIKLIEINCGESIIFIYANNTIFYSVTNEIKWVKISANESFSNLLYHCSESLYIGSVLPNKIFILSEEDGEVLGYEDRILPNISIENMKLLEKTNELMITSINDSNIYLVNFELKSINQFECLSCSEFDQRINLLSYSLVSYSDNFNSFASFFLLNRTFRQE